MADNKISIAVIRRLPKYRRCIKEMMDNGIDRISSKELSEIIGFTASQIRQDLNNFGGFGQQGYGYNIEDLYNEIGNILGLNRTYNTIIIGAGNLGQALAKFEFNSYGFNLKCICDRNPKIIGLKIGELEVLNSDLLEKEIENKKIDIAYICTDKDSAQEVADRLIKCGIKAIWNFAPIDIVSDEAVIENVHLIDSLFALSYFLKNN